VYQKAFANLRQLLASLPVLAYPNFCLPFMLETDASGDGVSSSNGRWVC